MSDHTEYPSSSEKLSSKFILDSLKRPRRELPEAPVETEPTTEETAESPNEDQMEFEECGTLAGDSITPVEEPPLVEMTPADDGYQGIELPAEKRYFRIGEVAELIGVETHVLRYWESEFKSIKPSKTGSGQRVYSRKDVETLHYVRHLLHTEKFSIKGAKKKLSERRRTKQTTVAVSDSYWEKRAARLKAAVSDLKEMIQILRHESTVT